MGNDWTRLTQEAGELDGPDGLRAHYKMKGRAEAAAGILALTLAGGSEVGRRQTAQPGRQGGVRRGSGRIDARRSTGNAAVALLTMTG